VYSSSQGCHAATGTHMPHGITHCYLPPGRGDIPALTPAEAGTRLSDPGGMQGRVNLLACYIPRWHNRPETLTHPGTNRARRALTSFIRRTPLTTTPRRQPLSVVHNYDCDDLVTTVQRAVAGTVMRLRQNLPVSR